MHEQRRLDLPKNEGPLARTRVAQCIDKEILIRKFCNIDIDIDKEDFEKLIIY